MSWALDWLAGEGWLAYFRDKGSPFDGYPSAEGYRARHMVDGFVSLATVTAKMMAEIAKRR